MTIADELQHYNDGLIDAYDAVDAKGGTIPQNKNLDNLPTAIGSISGGGGGALDPEEVYRQTRPADWLKMPEIGENEDNVIYLLLQIDANATADIYFDYGVYLGGTGTVTWEFGTTDSAGVFTPNSALTVTRTGSSARFPATTLAPSVFGNTTSEGLSQLICKISASGANITQTKRNRSASAGIINSLLVETKLKATNATTMPEVARLYKLRYYNDVGSSALASFAYMFQYCYALVAVPQLDTSTGTSFADMFIGCHSLVAIPQLDTSAGTTFSSMFQDCHSLPTIPQLDTSAGTTFSSMFQNCYNLNSVPLFDTSGGNVPSLFSGCQALREVPRLDVSSSSSVSSMFQNCYSLTAIPQLDTSSATNFGTMFQNCYALTGIPQLDTSAGTSFSQMFSSCTSLTEADLTGFDFSQTTTTSALSGILSNAIRTNQTIEFGDKWPAGGILNTGSILSLDGNPSETLPVRIKINKTDAMLPIAANATTLFSSNQYVYVYVPDALLATYQADTYWATLGTRLKGFSELPS